jgi:hypothetical protein
MLIYRGRRGVVGSHGWDGELPQINKRAVMATDS